VSALFHRWHHSDEKEGEGKNFAIVFSFIDVLFGSFYLPKRKDDSSLFGISQAKISNSLCGQFIYLFRRLIKITSK
jgi:sterol desaturase/sphingolipid hydroxylase (fatty acid hydroxylase superfamily)|tara:strand:- start:152 stop:379 length:228 start_codon:yes stop_codon:yes gene_type:complete